MIKQLVGIYDKKAKCYISINEVPNTAMACRDFMSACKDEKSTLAKFPEDFQIEKIGEFNDQNGELKQVRQVLLEAENCVVNNTEK